MDLVLDAQHDHAQWHIHLRRCESHTVGREHRLDHVVHQPADAVVHARNARRSVREHVVVVRREDYGQDRHVWLDSEILTARGRRRWPNPDHEGDVGTPSR